MERLSSLTRRSKIPSNAILPFRLLIAEFCHNVGKVGNPERSAFSSFQIGATCCSTYWVTLPLHNWGAIDWNPSEIHTMFREYEPNAPNSLYSILVVHSKQWGKIIQSYLFSNSFSFTSSRLIITKDPTRRLGATFFGSIDVSISKQREEEDPLLWGNIGLVYMFQHVRWLWTKELPNRKCGWLIPDNWTVFYQRHPMPRWHYNKKCHSNETQSHWHEYCPPWLNRQKDCFRLNSWRKGSSWRGQRTNEAIAG